MKQTLNEQFIRMQKLAGIITENKQSSVKDQVDAILSTNINPKLDTFIQPVKFILDQAFAEDIDIYTILEEAKQEMEFQLERANNNKDLSLIFAKIEALLNNEEAGLNEALNKDIKTFGQDLDKNLKAAGFQTLILVGKPATDEQKKKVKTDLGLAIIETYENPEVQALTLYVNPKEFEKAKKITDKFQLSTYNGQKMTLGKGWDTVIKQVKGALNPGDIYDAGENSGHGLFYFARLAKVDTKTAVAKPTIEEDITKPVPSDVKALSNVQKTATAISNKAKAINSIQEFPGAFENWFQTLGFQPGKISRSIIRAEVEKVLVKLGYK